VVDGTELLDGAVTFWFLASKLFSQFTTGFEDEKKVVWSTHLIAREADDHKVLLFVFLIQFLES
jgi:hypothetical protein